MTSVGARGLPPGGLLLGRPSTGRSGSGGSPGMPVARRRLSSLVEDVVEGHERLDAARGGEPVNDQRLQVRHPLRLPDVVGQAHQQVLDGRAGCRPRAVGAGEPRQPLGHATLEDPAWAAIARQHVAAMGLAGYPWVAVRHGVDHVHVVAGRVNATGGCGATARTTPGRCGRCGPSSASTAWSSSTSHAGRYGGAPGSRAQSRA